MSAFEAVPTVETSSSQQVEVAKDNLFEIFLVTGPLDLLMEIGSDEINSHETLLMLLCVETVAKAHVFLLNPISPMQFWADFDCLAVSIDTADPKHDFLILTVST